MIMSFTKIDTVEAVIVIVNALLFFSQPLSNVSEVQYKSSIHCCRVFVSFWIRCTTFHRNLPDKTKCDSKRWIDNA